MTRRERWQDLTDQEAAALLARHGPNETPRAQPRQFLSIVFETMREPMFMLLLGAALLYVLLGDIGEGLFLLGGAVATIGLVIFQDYRSERALEALRDLAQPFARVVRGGIDRKIPAKDLVPGDMLLIGEGERVQADGILLGGGVLKVDESALTGESVAVDKRPADDSHEQKAEGATTSARLFAGTVVVAGQGVARVSHTGSSSALGKIGTSLAASQREPTPLQRKTAKIVTLIGFAALIFCVVVAVAIGMVRQDWAQGLLAGITIAIALVPEEFPMVLAIFLALGAWRLATHRVLVRRAAAVETLGGTTVLCVDKTGTLTENRMHVDRVWSRAGDSAVDDRPLSELGARVLSIARLASAARPTDPMDRALRQLPDEIAGTIDVQEGEPVQVWPLRRDLLAVVQLWRQGEGGYLAAAKGAPEAIFNLCRLGSEERSHLQKIIEAYATEGLRVLGVASTRVSSSLGDPLDVAFDLAGLVAFIDPLRPDAPQALREATEAGIRVAMITGDHPATALAIGRMVGIDTSAGVVTGAAISELSDQDLGERLQHVRVYARIAPEQKLRIVSALKARGEIVAMTGDGVNDAPALQAAHVGIAMGKKGTDVAREASDLVLQDDNFASIVGGIRLGRRIFRNLRNSMIFIMAVHVPIAGLALIPIVLGMPQLLFPVHVVLLELVIDPTCALVFETEPSDARAMKRPPRRSGEGLFGLRQMGLGLFQGGFVFAGVIGVYAWGLQAFLETEARALAFVTLVIGILALALTNSASSTQLFAPHRRVFWLIALIVTAIVGLAVFAPSLAGLFQFSGPTGQSLVLALAVGLVTGSAPLFTRSVLSERLS